MGRWIALRDDEEQDYLNGEVFPIEIRESANGLEVYDPHSWTGGRLFGGRICGRCGLMPLDYDSIEIPCDKREVR